MELDAELARSFAEGALASFDVTGLDLDREAALRALETEFCDDFLELNEAMVRFRRWERCALEGTRPEDFAEHLVEVGGGRKILCGIRHLGLNLEKPFVRLWPNFALSSAAEAKALYETFLEERFACFRPICIRIFTPSGKESEAAGALHLAARARSYFERDAWPGEGELTLADPGSDDYYAWYAGAYRRFHEAHPALKDRVTLNDAAFMEDCRQQGLLRVARWGGERIGLIAAERERFLGHSGIYFVELLLLRGWQGRGLAKALQRKFVVSCCVREDLVWGMIESKNAASLRTALANGRKVVRGECFLML